MLSQDLVQFSLTLPLLSFNYVQKTQIIQEAMQLQHNFW